MHPMKSHRSCCFTRILLRAGKNVRTSGRLVGLFRSRF
jgi:hypothetical protein